MENQYLVSVIVPCYNQAEFLAATLQSVLDQTYPHWECIIINDGSPDNTDEIAKKFCDLDSRFQYIYQENKGRSATRNLGISISRGEYIQFLDSDDVIHPEKFEIQLKNVPENTGLLISSYLIFNKDVKDAVPNKWTSFVPKNIAEEIFLKWGVDFTIPIHTTLFHSDYFKKHQIRFREELSAIEDWIVWIACTQINDRFIFEKKPLAYYRRHPNSTCQNYEMMMKSTIQAHFIMKEIFPDEQNKELISNHLLNVFLKPYFHQEKGKKKYKKLFGIMCVVSALLLLSLIYIVCH